MPNISFSHFCLIVFIEKAQGIERCGSEKIKDGVSLTAKRNASLYFLSLLLTLYLLLSATLIVLSNNDDDAAGSVGRRMETCEICRKRMSAFIFLCRPGCNAAGEISGTKCAGGGGDDDDTGVVMMVRYTL